MYYYNNIFIKIFKKNVQFFHKFKKKNWAPLTNILALYLVYTGGHTKNTLTLQVSVYI